MSRPRAVRRPRNHIELLASVVESAGRASVWRRKLGSPAIRSLADFEQLPVTTVAEYRRQRLDSLIAAPGEISWIAGPLLGQSPRRPPTVEGADEARIRMELMGRALSHAVPKGVDYPTALVATTSESRYFGAEICGAFVREGVPAHLVTDRGSDRLSELVEKLEPTILTILSPVLDANSLPASVLSVVTINAAAAPAGVRNVDLLAQNELGTLGVAIDGGEYSLSHDSFHFETSDSGTLIATPYFSHVRPIIRLDTRESVARCAPYLA